MADHDQLFKTLLQTFFAEFIRLFFAEWADRFDFSDLEFLQGELFTDVPEGEQRSVDVVARLRVRQEIVAARPGAAPNWLALIHVEIESADRVAPLRPRMFDYYWMLRHRHRLPVLPIGLYLRVGLDGVGWDEYEEYFWERRLVYFEYAYVGLPGLDAEQYFRGDNMLGVALAALMRVPEERRAELKAESLRRVKLSKEDEARRFLLANIIQTYLLLDETQQAEFERLMSREEYSGVPEMITTWAEQEREKGRQEGREMIATWAEQEREKGAIENSRRLVQAALERRFGPLTPQALTTIQGWPLDRLEETLMALLEGKSLADLGLDAASGSHA
jgi:hypothetical protein